MNGALVAIAERERLVVGAGLAAVVALAWWYLVRLAGAMPAMDVGMAMPDTTAWGAAELVLAFVMWAVMMVAMMLPAGAPMILMFATINRRRAAQGRPLVRTGVFVAGYVVVWTAYSAVAASAQWTLHETAMLSDALATTSAYVGAAVLVAAGVFQWTPLKRACLARCRSPLSFLMTEWREGVPGALVMGLRHGVYCVGCCFVLMALLFVAGVMNLAWVAAIAAFVFVERVVPRGDRIGALAGALMVIAGLVLVVHGHAMRPM